MYSIDRVDEQLLLKLALDSIVYGLEYGEQIQIKEDDFPPQLRETAATFVTLKTNGNLRGCIGALESHRSLVADVAANLTDDRLGRTVDDDPAVAVRTAPACPNARRGPPALTPRPESDACAGSWGANRCVGTRKLLASRAARVPIVGVQAFPSTPDPSRNSP